MEIGLPKNVAELWKDYDLESYTDSFLYEEDGYVFFVELPAWAEDPDVGPFYILDDAIYALSLRPSHKGDKIGNTFNN